jgi:hypothetical protein
MHSELNFYKNLETETFENESCFLCGKKCDSKTAEHIFPKWLQHKYNLWDKKLKISNGTTIPYRNLTVPCCAICNNEHLSQMEERFKKLLNKSFQDLSFDDEKTIFQWTGKILYATRYKELSLLIDRTKPNIGNILTTIELESYSSLHLFLQSIRYKTEFNEPKPWSIFIFNCKDDKFFYHNILSSLCLSMKFGKVSITIVYEDNNIISDFMGAFKNLGDYKINFAQYLEINAHIFYSATLKENVPKYFSHFNRKTEVLTVNTMGDLRSREWNDKEYSINLDYLLLSCKIDIGQSTLQSNGTITTFLIDENNKRLITDPNKNKKAANNGYS